jgi:hypothetical protein
MSARPHVVQKIRLLAFDAVRDGSLPPDLTVQEQAEGLISFAVALLRYQSGADEAVAEGMRIVEKYRELPSSCYFDYEAQRQSGPR